MSAAQLMKMRQGRERQIAEQREQYATQQAAYRNWVRNEAIAYRTLLAARDIFGEQSGQARGAHEQWYSIVSAMPTPPPDSAWS